MTNCQFKTHCMLKCIIFCLDIDNCGCYKSGLIKCDVILHQLTDLLEDEMQFIKHKSCNCKSTIPLL